MTSNASGGAGAPGGSSASTDPPKPPPTIRAPAAPARLSALDGRLDLGHRHLVVVAQARVRGVEQRAGLLEVAAPRAASVIASTRAFSLTTWRTRRLSGSGRPSKSVGVAQRLDAERLAGRRGTPRGARCSRRRRASARRRSRAVTSVPVAELERHRLERRACGSRSAARARAASSSDASWSSRPVCGADPVVLHARAELGERDAVGRLGQPSRARHSAVSSAAEEERPEPCGRSPVIVRRAARDLVAGGAAARHDAAHERPPALAARGLGERRTRRSSPRSSAPARRTARRPAARRSPSRRGRSRTAARARRCSRCARRSG